MTIVEDFRRLCDYTIARINRDIPSEVKAKAIQEDGDECGAPFMFWLETISLVERCNADINELRATFQQRGTYTLDRIQRLDEAQIALTDLRGSFNQELPEWYFAPVHTGRDGKDRLERLNNALSLQFDNARRIIRRFTDWLESIRSEFTPAAAAPTVALEKQGQESDKSHTPIDDEVFDYERIKGLRDKLEAAEDDATQLCMRLEVAQEAEVHAEEELEAADNNYNHDDEDASEATYKQAEERYSDAVSEAESLLKDLLEANGHVAHAEEELETVECEALKRRFGYLPETLEEWKQLGRTVGMSEDDIGNQPCKYPLLSRKHIRQACDHIRKVALDWHMKADAKFKAEAEQKRQLEKIKNGNATPSVTTPPAADLQATTTVPVRQAQIEADKKSILLGGDTLGKIFYPIREARKVVEHATDKIFAPIREANKTMGDAAREIWKEAEGEIREAQSAKSRYMEEIAANARRGVSAAVEAMNAGRRASELPALYWPTKSADPLPPASSKNGTTKKTVGVVIEEVEKIVKASKGKWPGYAALVKKGYAKGTLQNAVKQSVYLKARLAESEATRVSGKKPKTVSLTETVENIEADKRETELRRLMGEQEADNKADARRVKTRK
ncbi:MAG: hypothetical protein FWD53_05825 [Phycisphaerales bacterium]|nr:hypothetical protein [Phycisphaerales bacterium]